MFHHLHLNSINPDAAIDFYTKAFPSTSKETFAGQPALRSPNNVWVLFNKVAAPPATQPATAFWHFGWHVTDVRATLDRFVKSNTPLLPLYTGEGARTVFVSSDTYPGSGGVLGLTAAGVAAAKATGIKPAGVRGSRISGDPTMRWLNTRGTCRRSASITCTCIRTSRSARSSGIKRT